MDMTDFDFEVMLLSGRYLGIPTWLNEYCALDTALLEEEEWVLEDAVNVAIRRLLLEHFNTEASAINERHICDKCFLHVFCQVCLDLNAAVSCDLRACRMLCFVGDRTHTHPKE